METELYGQFTLGRRDVPAPPGFAQDLVGSWTLRHHPSLTVRRLVDAAGAAVGWLLGDVLDAGGCPAEASIPVGAATSAQEIADTHRGRFAVIRVAGPSPQLALDAFGSLAVVFDPAREVAGSTTTVLDPLTPAREREIPPFAFHPAGLTGDPEKRRLLPHHALDLDTWRAVRRYGMSAARHADLDLDTRADRIVSRLRQTLVGFAERARLYITLSSGYDSRLLLACAQPVWDRVELVTFDYRERRSDRIDLAIARRIASSLGLRHHVLSIEAVSEADREHYRFRIGYAGNAGKARDFDQACRRHLEMDRVLISGFAMDIGRGLYWARVPRASQRGRSLDDLLHLMRLPAEDEICAAVSQWSAALSDVSLERLYDLLFCEQRYGCWAMPHLYGFAPFAMTPLPACDREVVDLLLSAPLQEKLSNRLSRTMIRRACVSLDAFPYKTFDFAGRWRERLGAPARRWRRMRAAAPSF